MFRRLIRLSSPLVLGAVLALSASAQAKREKTIALAPLGTYSAGLFDKGGALINAHDPRTQRLFIVNAGAHRIDIVDIGDPVAPLLVGTIDITSIGANPLSVAIHDGLVAVSIEGYVRQDPGAVAFYDTDGGLLNVVQVGALPDHVTFTPNGKRVLVANEGEPSTTYSVDPEGSISIIDLVRRVHGQQDPNCDGVENLAQHCVRTAGFAAFSAETLDPSIKINGPGSSVAQDLEPEYIAADNDTAWVTIQDNNALAIVDIKSGVVVDLIGLGVKDYRLAGNGIDASDSDGVINIANWPVYGLYQPDSVVAFKERGQTFLAMANEGDAREYSAITEAKRVSTLALDATAFPDAAALKTATQIGRLNVLSTLGDVDRDGDYDQLYALGARSLTIRDENGNLVSDTGDSLERETALATPAFFNSTNTANNFDNRSDDKGPEPEALAIARFFGKRYALVGLERFGGLAVYEIEDPAAPKFVGIFNNRNFSGVPAAGTAGDLGPEGITVVEACDSPTGNPLVIVSNEISSTTTVWEVSGVTPR